MMSVGELVLALEYQKYAIPTNVWLSKTNEDRTRALNRFFLNRKPTVPGQVTSTDYKLTIPIHKAAGKKPNQRR